jgi:hypothetical protein
MKDFSIISKIHPSGLHLSIYTVCQCFFWSAKTAVRIRCLVKCQFEWGGAPYRILLQMINHTKVGLTSKDDTEVQADR